MILTPSQSIWTPRFGAWWRCAKEWRVSLGALMALKADATTGHLTYKSTGGHLVYCPPCIACTTYPDALTVTFSSWTACTNCISGGLTYATNGDLNGTYCLQPGIGGGSDSGDPCVFGALLTDVVTCNRNGSLFNRYCYIRLIFLSSTSFNLQAFPTDSTFSPSTFARYFWQNGTMASGACNLSQTVNNAGTSACSSGGGCPTAPAATFYLGKDGSGAISTGC